MRIAREEIFGPVLAVIDVDELSRTPSPRPTTRRTACRPPSPPAIRATCTPSRNDIQSGTVKINRTTTGNLVNAPFGGLKWSSTSTFRESGRAGLEFYTQTKTVYRGC